MQFVPIENLKETNFYEVFCNNELNYENKVFLNEDWKFLFFTLEHFLFNEKNKFFIKSFSNFFREEENFLYITPSIFDGNGSYPTIKFSSQLDLFELPYIIADTDGQEMMVNWTDDFLWNDKGSWGICHDRHNGVFILGYNEKVKYKVKKYLLNHSNRIFIKELQERIEDNYQHSSQDEILREKRREYINNIKKNNLWFVL